MFKIILIIFAGVILLLAGGLIIWYFAAPTKTDNANIVSNKTPEQAANKITQKPKGERNPKLQADADEFLPLFDRMPSVPVYLTDEPIQKGSEGKDGGVAYNVCESKSPTIFMKRAFYEKGNRKQIVNILKHELTHAFFCRQGIQTGHDARFREKFTQVGGFGN